MQNQYKKIALDGLWKNNPALVQILGLCPLLAVTSSVVNALALGLATTIVLIGTNSLISLIRNLVPNEIRIPVFVMIIASLVTCVELLMQALVFELYLILGIFVPLIVTNCIIIGRAEAFASKNRFPAAMMDGAMQGCGFTAVLVLLGAMRELLGQGTLFHGAALFFGDWASALSVTIFHVDSKFLFAILPPGAFFAMGLMIALKNLIDSKLKARQKESAPTKVIQRVRVTGE